MRWYTALVSVLLLSSSPYAAEESATAKFLLPYCKQPAGSYYSGVCRGLLMATMQIHQANTLLDPDMRMALMCSKVPADVTDERVLGVMARYADMHPAETELSFPLFVIAALRDEWCK
jgi:hypothetical protein